MTSLALLLPAMRMGGAEKVCIPFLHDLVKYYDVTLILTKLEGELLCEVPACVNMIEDSILPFTSVVKSDISHFRFGMLFRDIRYYLNVKMGRDLEKNYRYIVSRTPAIDREFDVAISYVANVSTQIFSLADRIKAKKKIAWIHGETTAINDTELFESLYSSFDRIYAVSGVTKEHFIKRFPSCATITDVYYNGIIAEDILRKADESPDVIFNHEEFNIVTVGRLTPEKGCDMIPAITAHLRNCYPVHWYIIGDGTSRAIIQREIIKYGVSDSVTLLGTIINPYPYMKACDLYVQPSYEEGYSTTICEAAILGKAIVGTTTSGGIREQIENDITGFIVDPVPDKIAELIADLVTDTEKLHKIEKTVKEKNFLHKDEIKKLISFLNA